MAQKFKVGDRVILKSGGPVMTCGKFDTYSGRTGYLCKWFDAKQQVTTDVFEEDELDLYTSPLAAGRAIRSGDDD